MRRPSGMMLFGMIMASLLVSTMFIDAIARYRTADNWREAYREERAARIAENKQEAEDDRELLALARWQAEKLGEFERINKGLVDWLRMRGQPVPDRYVFDVNERPESESEKRDRDERERRDRDNDGDGGDDDPKGRNPGKGNGGNSGGGNGGKDSPGKSGDKSHGQNKGGKGKDKK